MKNQHKGRPLGHIAFLHLTATFFWLNLMSTSLSCCRDRAAGNEKSEITTEGDGASQHDHRRRGGKTLYESALSVVGRSGLSTRTRLRRITRFAPSVNGWAVHAHAAAASDQIELVAVADVQRALAEKIAAAYAVETIYGDGADLLADARVEAVALALPACFRIQLGVQALRAGKHLLTEKPVARNADEVRQLICVQGDRVAACCSSRFQFLESARVASDWIGQGRLGALRLLRCRAIMPARPAPETRPPAWRLSRALNGGGVLVNWGCYDLDYLLGISGWRLRPQTVLAQSWRIPSAFAGLVRCADGIALTYERGEYTAAQAEASWEVIGEGGSLRLWMTPAQEKEILYFEGNRAQGTIPQTLWQGNESYEEINRAVLEDFATAIRTGRPPKTTLARALLVQQITDALYRSAETGEAVRVNSI